MSEDKNLIRISPNGRYFIQDNKPFFWLGDTQWELFRDFSIEDAEAILEIRKEQGFSVIQIMFTGVGDGTKPNIEGQPPWVNNDPAKPNEAYFKRVDQIIEIAHKKGIIINPGVYHQLQVSIITLEKARNYAKWIAERYKHMPNIIWSMYPKAEQEYIPVIRELAMGLREGDEGIHLITLHPDPAVTSSSFIHNESWLDFNMIQTWLHYDRIYDMVTHDYNLIPIKPTVMAEGGYEGEESGKLQTPLEIRKQAYWSYLAGGHHSYGHDDNYSSPSTWRSWINALGANHVGIYKKTIMALKEWWNWIPDQSIIVDGVNSGINLNVSARSTNGDWIMVYISSPTSVSIKMDKITAKNNIQASLVNPTNGERASIGNYQNSGVQSFKTPDNWKDAVLILEAI